MRHFDLVIVGTGSGNSIVDHRFADRDVAIVERGTFGGTCLNVGCIPTKMFVHTADVAATPADSARFGVDETLDGVRWTAIRNRIFGRIDPISAAGRAHRLDDPDNGNVTLYEGQAAFTGPKQLLVTPNDGSAPVAIEADQIVLAAGSRPVLPELAGLDGVAYHTSDTVMRIDRLPDTLTILGSGFVATEFAHIFGSLGVDVTLVARSELLLRRDEDFDVATRFTELARHQWDVRTKRTAERAEQHAGTVRLYLDGPDGRETVDAEVLLVAVGRQPNTDLLDVGRAGLATTEDGFLVVDQYQRTTVDGVWALGDICSPAMLKHVANHEERTVQHNLLHPDALVASDHRAVPHAVFSSPQVAAVGLTEQRARELGVDYVVGEYQLADIAYGWALEAEAESGFAKLLADPRTGLLLGGHVMAPNAATVIQPVIQAMSFGMDARTLARGQYWIHPAPSELIENALLRLPFASR
ncbi:MAG TPA: mycothione reductase [Streptosporangiales bacterium]